MGDSAAKAETSELRKTVNSLKEDLGDLAKQAKSEAAACLSAAHEKTVGRSAEWAKEHPAASIGIIAGAAASVGFIIGLLVGRARN